MHTSPSSFTQPSWRHALPFVGIVLLGFALRVYRLDAQPLSGDEAFSMVNWLDSLSYTFGTLATIDPQPPGALLALYGWVHLVGRTEFAARYLSVLASTLAIAPLYGMGRLLKDRRAGMLAAFLWAVNPYQIWFAQDLRNTALWVGFSALSTWLALRAIRRPCSLAPWVLYVVTTALSLYTFYLEFFVLAFHNLFALGQRREQGLLWRWGAAQVGLGVLLAPWFLQPRLYTSGYRPTAGRVNIPWTVQAFVFGETLPAPFQRAPFDLHRAGLAAVIALGLAGLFLVVIWLRSPRQAALFVSLYTLLPVALLSALTVITGSGYFRPRYLVSSAPGWALLIGLGLSTLARKGTVYRTLAGVLTLGIALLSMVGIWHYHFNPTFAKAPNSRGLMAVLDTQIGPDDVIIRNFPGPDFDYYYDGPASTVVLPHQGTNPGPELNTLTQEHAYVWFLPQPDKVWDSEQVVAAWLNGHLQLVSDQWIDTIRLQQYAAYEAERDQIAHPLTVAFGDLATLAGYRVTPPLDDNPGCEETLAIELFWIPQKTAKADLTVFVHLLGPPREDGSPLWSQDDHPPQMGRANTTIWPVGVLLRDVYRVTIPPDAPAGTYHLTVGIYDPDSGTRLPITGSDVAQPEPEGALLLTITLGEPGQ